MQKDEATYIAKFDRLGLTLVRDTLNRGGFTDEPEHQAALRWVTEKIARLGELVKMLVS